MIFVTGDTHGGVDEKKLHETHFVNGQSLTKDDYVIICGDFGYIFYPINNNTQEYYKLKWFEKQPWTTLFIDGNHENHKRLNEYPIEEWHGGKIHRINDSVLHLMRGQVFNIEGKTFFTMGGAESIDKNMRIMDVSWWKEELPNHTEIEEGFCNLEKHNNKVDYVITHTCPTSVTNQMKINGVFNYVYKDPTSELLEQYMKILDFKHWWFGHFHFDVDINSHFTCLYHKIVDIL